MEYGVSADSTVVHHNLDELRRPGLTWLCYAGLVASWVWITALGAGFPTEPQRMRLLLPAIWLFLACSTVLALGRAPLQWRNLLLLAGVGGTFSLGYLVAPSHMWLYGQALVVVIAGLLTGLRVSTLVAALLTLASLLCYRYRPGAVQPGDLRAALALLWAVTVISWLSVYNLYTALGWALHSREQAWETTNEVRARRAELRRTLDSLRVTQGILERTLDELDAARREAEEARQVKSRFVANISHELRTPLNVIVGFAEMLCTLPESYGNLAWPAALREDLLTIWRNAEHLLGMVDDVLDLAQIEAAHLPVVPEATDLLQLIRDTLVTAGPLLRDSHLELRVSLPESLPPLNLDRARIRQVLLNLINNATRFTDSGYIEVGAFLADQAVTVYVRDSGQGIPADKLETIFEEFEQTDTPIRRPHQGAGLGLAISKHFIQLHGGRIWAESTLGQGSTFSFSLPLDKGRALGALQAGRPLPARAAGEQEKGVVIALCTDALAVRMLERYLEGMQVRAARVPAEAVALVRQHHPEALLVAAESQEGLPLAKEQAREILRQVAPFDLPVLACSFPTERHAGLALGVGEFLIKPVTQKDVAAAIRRLCTMPRRVLIADDEPDMLRLLTRMVQQEWGQAEVFTAASGDEAIALLAQRPDVLLLDLLMPRRNGIEVLQALRADPATANIPVLVITARGPAEDLAAAHQGELYLLKGTGFAAGELMRVLELVTNALPPHYAAGSTSRPGTPATGPV